jgi:hypothetical protein
VHHAWQDACPPAIYVRILKIRGVKQLDHGLFCTFVCAPAISAALKVFGPKGVKNWKKNAKINKDFT